MSYTGLKERNRKRFNEVNTLLNYIQSIEPSDVNEDVPIEVKVIKGLFYVHLYAAFEKSVNDLVETSILLISSNRIPNKHFQPFVLSIILSDKVESLRQVSHKKKYKNATDLFLEAASNEITTLNESVFSSPLQNVWTKTLRDVFSAFGLKELKLLRSEVVTIDEIVDKRNAVAHGRDSASLVGERMKADELRKKMVNIQTVTDKLTDLLELHYINKRHIRPQFKRNYIV